MRRMQLCNESSLCGLNHGNCCIILLISITFCYKNSDITLIQLFIAIIKLLYTAIILSQATIDQETTTTIELSLSFVNS